MDVIDTTTTLDSPNGRIDMIPEPERKQFRLLSFQETVNQPEKEWFVEDVFGPGDVGMLFGDAGTGKTFVTIDLALECIYGGEFAGMWNITKPLTVLYMTDEGLQSFGERVASIATSKNLYDAYGQRYDKRCENFWLVADMLNLFNGDEPGEAQTPDGGMIVTLSDFETFVEQMGELEPNLIIVDTLSNASTGADENSNRDANIVARNVKRLISEFGSNCAVLIVHHVNKGIGDYRGASAYKGHADFMLKLIADEDDDDGAIMHFYKAKHTRKPVSRHCLRVQNEHFYYPKLLWSDYVAPAMQNIDQNKAGVMECFGIAEEWTTKALEDETSIKRSTLNRTLEALLSEGKLSRRLPNPLKSPGGANQWHYSAVNPSVHVDS